MKNDRIFKDLTGDDMTVFDQLATEYKKFKEIENSAHAEVQRCKNEISKFLKSDDAVRGSIFSAYFIEKKQPVIDREKLVELAPDVYDEVTELKPVKTLYIR